MVPQRSSSEDIPLENLSRSSTPVLGKPIPIAFSATVNSAIQLRNNSPKKHHSFDGGISVSSSPATSVLGSSFGGGGGGGGVLSGGLSGGQLAPLGLAVAKEESQETSFMCGPDDDIIKGEEAAEGGSKSTRESKRKGAIETV